MSLNLVENTIGDRLQRVDDYITAALHDGNAAHLSNASALLKSLQAELGAYGRLNATVTSVKTFDFEGGYAGHDLIIQGFDGRRAVMTITAARQSQLSKAGFKAQG